MGLNKIRIGDCVELYNEACGNPNLTIYDVSGVNREKEFFSPSKSVGEDTSKYKIVPPGYFACNLMHVGRDVVLPIALNTSNENVIVTAAYSVFRLINEDQIIKDYFMMFLKSPEKDRNFWFHTDSSVRDGMSWKDFCDITIELPPIDVQLKFVKVYLGMVENQKSYELGLEDLKLTCEGYIENLKKEIEPEEIGKYIKRFDVRNGENGTKNVMGISTSKCFREPTSKVNRNELANYKLVKPRQIGFVQTTHNEKCFAYAFNNTSEDIVISSVNEVFETNEQFLLPEYLCLFFNRTEFDRYARFHSWGSARETFTWKDLIKVKLPIADLNAQKAIAEVYTAYIMRKEINEQLKAQIKDICPILIKGSLEEARA